MGLPRSTGLAFGVGALVLAAAYVAIGWWVKRVDVFGLALKVPSPSNTIAPASPAPRHPRINAHADLPRKRSEVIGRNESRRLRRPYELAADLPGLIGVRVEVDVQLPSLEI